MNTDQNGSTTTVNLTELMSLMEAGRVIPVISNSFRIEQIFREDEELFSLMLGVPEFYDEVRTFDQQLTKKWAAVINYPMSDDHNLARVVQYRQVESGSPEGARRQYIRYLIDRLLKNNENDGKYGDTVARLRSLSKTPLFSDVVERLGYPRLLEGMDDSLRLLAQLPVRIYITTSFSNFLERALEAEDKKPRTQLCFYRGGKTSIKPEHYPDRDLYPTESAPAVVHLFGLEDYTNTLVLSEDDYINFLLNAVEDINQPEVFPHYLRTALQESVLLLMGYHLRDWDFRTLFRFLLKIRKIAEGDLEPSIAIQFNPSLGKKENEIRSRLYLETYFGKRNFRVKWAGTEEFVFEIWKTWSNYVQGQL